METVVHLIDASASNVGANPCSLRISSLSCKPDDSRRRQTDPFIHRECAMKNDVFLKAYMKYLRLTTAYREEERTMTPASSLPARGHGRATLVWFIRKPIIVRRSLRSCLQPDSFKRDGAGRRKRITHQSRYEPVNRNVASFLESVRRSMNTSV